jgi:hypothetical protein
MLERLSTGEAHDTEIRMKALFSAARLVLVAMTLLYGGLVAPPAAQAGGAGSLATNFVGRFYFNPTTLQGFVVGYLPDVAGVAGPLFNGGPSEATAYFTFRSDVFQFTELPTNGDLQLFLLSAGTYAIYFNPTPIGDWSNPDTFSSSKPIAQFKRPEGLFLEFTNFINHVIGEDLVSTRPFIFNGHNYNFRAISPGGLTLFNTGSTTPLPGPGIAGFPLVFPYAGSGIAVGANY